MAEPKIYTKNYIDADLIFAASHGQINLSAIFDTDKNSLYVTSGANSDSISITVEIEFQDENNDIINRTINRVIIVNHNMKDIEVEYLDVNGFNWISVATETFLTSSTTIISFSAVSAGGVRILSQTTQTPNQDKQLGLFFACEFNVDIGIEITALSVNYRQKQSILLMGDGQLQRTVVMHAPNRSAKYQAKVSFILLPYATFELLRAVK